MNITPPHLHPNPRPSPPQLPHLPPPSQNHSTYITPSRLQWCNLHAQSDGRAFPTSLPLNTMDVMGSGFPIFFLGSPEADSTTTRSMTAAVLLLSHHRELLLHLQDLLLLRSERFHPAVRRGCGFPPTSPKSNLPALAPPGTLKTYFHISEGFYVQTKD